MLSYEALEINCGTWYCSLLVYIGIVVGLDLFVDLMGLMDCVCMIVNRCVCVRTFVFESAVHHSTQLE